MSGVSVVLDRARIGLWSDPSTELAIPHLLGAPATITHAGTTVQFVGDTYPTGFRGESVAKSWAMSARFMAADRDLLLDALNLFETARTSPDSRLPLRTHYGQVPGLDECVAVQVFDPQPTPNLGGYWDLGFTAVVVESTVVV